MEVLVATMKTLSELTVVRQAFYEDLAMINLRSDCETKTLKDC